MESEEHEIRKIMFEKNLKLIYAEQSEAKEKPKKPVYTIDADQF